MNPLNIRPAVAADVPAITRIYAHAVEHGTASFEIEPPDETEMVRRLEALLAKRYPYIVAEMAAEVVGYAYAGPYRDRRAYDWCVEDSLYVAPELHRKGIGRLLLTQLIAAAEPLGYRQMLGVIGDSANTGSIGVHAALGFRHIGTLQSIGFKHGRWLDTVLMQRALGVSDATPPS